MRSRPQMRSSHTVTSSSVCEGSLLHHDASMARWLRRQDVAVVWRHCSGAAESAAESVVGGGAAESAAESVAESVAEGVVGGGAAAHSSMILRSSCHMIIPVALSSRTMAASIRLRKATYSSASIEVVYRSASSNHVQ